MKLKLTIDGKMYEVDVEVAAPEQPQPTYIPPVGQPGPSPWSPTARPPKSAARVSVADESKVCRSPIAGVVVRVAAQEGAAIKANEILLVLEAMKMETVITSPVDGHIAKLNVNVGDSVQNGQVLVEFT